MRSFATGVSHLCRTIFAVAATSASIFPAVAQAQSSQCNWMSGNATCVSPIEVKEWACVGSFAFADSQPCRGLFTQGQHCKSDDEAIEQAINNYMEALPTCERPTYGPFCPAPWIPETVTYFVGEPTLISHAYIAKVPSLVNGQCVPSDNQYCGSPNVPNHFYGAKANCQRLLECPPGSYSPNTTYPCKTYKSEVCPLGNPFDCVTGNKAQTEVDIPQTEHLLEFVRYYSSSGFYEPVGTGAEYDPGLEPRIMGIYWRHTYQKAVMHEPAPAGFPEMVTVTRPDGDYRHFKFVEGAWTGRTDRAETLEELIAAGVRTGWRYRSRSDEVETYDSNGVLLSIESPSGDRVDLTYSDANTPPTIAPIAGLLTEVRHSSGRGLGFEYNELTQLVRVVDNGGSAHQYSYTDARAVRTVTRPDGTTREYKYNEPEHFANGYAVQVLTGIVDENGDRYATYKYSHNKITEEWHGSAFANRMLLTYTSGPWPPYHYARTTGPLGNFEQRHLVQVAGTVREGVMKRCSNQGCSVALTQRSTNYMPDGNVDSTINERGVLTDYTHDNRGRELVRVEAANVTAPDAASKRTIETDWHSIFNSPVERRVLGHTGVLTSREQWVYNARGQVTARCEFDPADPVAMTYSCSNAAAPPVGAAVRRWVTTYCEFADVQAGTCPREGLITSSNGPRTSGDAGMGGLDDVTTYTYYPADASGCGSGQPCAYRHGDLWKITNATGHETEYVAYDGAGRVQRIKDANGTYLDFTYYPRGWLAERIVRSSASGTPGPADSVTSMTYDAVGNVTRVTQSDGSYLDYSYDDAHRLIAVADNVGNAIDYCPGGLGSADCLDGAGNRRIEQIKDPSGNVKRQLRRTYNQLNQLTQVLNAASLPVETSLGMNATGIADGHDRIGNRVLSADGLGVVTRQEFDPLDRLKATIQNYGGSDTATANTTTQYVYDAADNLRQVTDPNGLNTVYDYDGLNNLSGLHSPDTGDTTYTYDAAGNRIGQTDARGVTSSYTYDALNRLTAVGYPDTSLNVSYAYDEADGVTGCSGSFPKGRLTRMADESGQTSYCYDRRGNIMQKVHTTSGGSRVTAYGYSLADRLTSLTYPSGAVVTYGRDAVGRVQSVSWQPDSGTAPTTLVSATTYAPFGPLTSVTFGNGRTQTRAYDQDYAIDAISGTPAGALTLEFEVDVMGNIVEASGSLSPSIPDRIYTYDPLYRLTASQTGATPPASLESYTYNATGDRLSASLNGNPADAYAYVPNTHRLASVGMAARTYDDNGNTLTGTPSGYALTYDDRNRLSEAVKPPASIVTYHYNGKGERLEKVVSDGGANTTTAFAYDEGGRLLGEYGDAGNVLAEFVYLDDRSVAVIKDATPYYVEADHLGTPRQVINPATDGVLWKWDLLESTFGANGPDANPDGDSATFTLNFRFPGQYYDVEIGSSYNYFRDYEAGTGRYVESDPIGLDGGPTTYGYADGSPLFFSDPLGLATYVNFPPDQEAEMRNALEEAKRKLQECKGKPDCWEDDQHDKVIKKLENARYVYRPDMVDCGEAGRFPGARTIKLSPSTFNWGECCDLASTLAHEANHLGRPGKSGGEDASQQLEKLCFNCPRPQR